MVSVAEAECGCYSDSAISESLESVGRIKQYNADPGNKNEIVAQTVI